MNEIPHPGFNKPEEYETFTTTNGLEEAAKEYTDGKPWAKENYLTPYIREAFIAGAKWQAEQLLKSSPLPEDTVLFNKGVAEGRRLAEEEQADLFTIVALDAAQRAKEQMLKDGNVILTEEDFEAEKEKSMEWGYNLCKEQMMKEAVEGLFQNTPFPTICLDDCKDYNFKDNQKVRIIIVKEDEI